MTLRSLAIRNVWRSRGRYLAYVGSAAFAVAIYFLYTTLTYHPTLRSGYFGAQYVTIATRAAAIVIAAFTFLFLLYSGAAFARYRMKEFGMLTMLGLTRWQLARMILWENLLVAAAALAIGLGLGLLFLKLFFMAVSALLRLPEELPFYAGAPVWVQTVAVFGGFFLVVSLSSLRGAFRQNVVDLIRASRKPKAVPVFSPLKALLGLVLVATGYAWASRPNAMVIVLGVVPVTAMVSLGTYLLLKEGSIAFLRWLHRRDRLFYRPRPFLVISQLIFKMQDNYRVLSAVSLLIAVILSAMGTFYSLYVVLAEDALTRAPQAIQIVVTSGSGAWSAVKASDTDRSAEPLSPAAAELGDRLGRLVDQLLARHGVSGLSPERVSLLEATLGNRTVYVIPSSTYRRLYRPSGNTQVIAGADSAVLIYPFVSPQEVDGGIFSAPTGDGLTGEQTVAVGTERLTLEIVADRSGRLFNEPFASYVLVVADETYERLSGLPGVPRSVVLAWTGPTWRGKAMEAVIAQLNDALGDEPNVALSADILAQPQIRPGPGAPQPDAPRASVTTTLEHFRSLIALVGVALFVGLFVSLVFFAATCSLLYFRLFTELDEDRRYLRRLHELGLSRQEANQLSRLQNAIIFLVPFVVGLVHSTFAMKALSTLMMRNVIYGGWLVALGYLAAYILYFAAADSVYRRAVGSRSLA